MMTEHDLWGKIREPLNRHGVATRLENAAAMSVPDILFVSGGAMVFIEMKIVYGEKVYMPIFQHSYGKRISHYINDFMHWVAAWDDEAGSIRMYTFRQVSTCPISASGNKLTFNISQCKPKYILTRPESWSLWVDELMKKLFQYG